MIIPALVSLLGLATPDTLTAAPIARIEVRADFFTTDNLGNCYVIRKDELLKYSPSGDSLSSQSIKSLGSITFVDAANSLRILLFYRDLFRLVLLDNTLSQQGEAVQLDRIGYPFAQLVCQSPNNQNIWLYETEEFRLLRLDRNMQPLQNSGNLSQVLGYGINPDFMQEYDNRLYLNDPQRGVLVFDMFGTYYKTIPLKGLRRFQVTDRGIFYLRDRQLYRFDLLGLTEEEIVLPFQGIKGFRIEKQQLFLQTEDFIHIFPIR